MKHYRIKPGERVKLHDKTAGDTGDYRKEDAAKHTDHLREKLEALQERLYAEGKRSLLIVLQGIDTSGKDGTVRHVMGGVNPQGCIVTSFKAPTAQEKAHDFLWRVHAACPPRGYIGLFNRSHYEDVLISRVHGWITDKEADVRMKEIRDFEKMLTNNGTRILKFFLHISKDEQKKRFLSRIDHPDKHWKFNPEDLKERRFWKTYKKAFEQAISSTSTDESPWFVVPADHKWYRNLVVADRIVDALEEMNPRLPKVQGVDWKQLHRSLQTT